MFYSKFSCWNLWHENGHGFAKYIFCPYISLVREYCSGASPPANIAAALRRPGAFYGALPQTPHAFLKKAWEK
ncbi:MAG: hypothetical protein DBX61_11730 [Clostridiales bacterium]|nr:MAG: hypothetical protein DBX61_11730 [Clostridiales bacterium]